MVAALPGWGKIYPLYDDKKCRRSLEVQAMAVA